MTRNAIPTFAWTAVLLLTAVTAMNAWVDPRGAIGTDAFPAWDADPLQQKMKVVATWTDSPPVLFAGASSSLNFTSAGAVEVGLGPALNLGVPRATAADVREILEYYSRHHEPPARVFITLDLLTQGHAFEPIVPLSTAAGEVRGEPAASLVDGLGLISPGQTFSTAKSFWYALTGYPVPRITFEPDGSARYPQWELAVKRGQHDLEAVVRQQADGFVLELAEDVQTRVAFEENGYPAIVEWARDHGVALTFFIPPIQPRMEALLDAHIAGWADREREWRDRALRLCPWGEVYDFGDLASWGGDPNAFRDALHANGVNTERMLKNMATGNGQLCEQLS